MDVGPQNLFWTKIQVNCDYKLVWPQKQEKRGQKVNDCEFTSAFSTQWLCLRINRFQTKIKGKLVIKNNN